MHIASIGIDLGKTNWLHWENGTKFWFARSSHARSCWHIPRTCRNRLLLLKLVPERTSWELHCENKVMTCG